MKMFTERLVAGMASAAGDAHSPLDARPTTKVLRAMARWSVDCGG